MFFQLFAVPAILIILVLFLPDLLPRCSLCGRLKARPFVRIHKAVGLSPGYRGYRSVCTRCCRKYDISDISDLNRLKDIRRRLQLEALKRDAGL